MHEIRCDVATASALPVHTHAPAAIGHLHLLWWWALEHASPGSLDNVSGKEVAEVCMWRGRPAELLRALTGAGLLDADRTIHDWADYTGRLLDRRRANRDRMRLARATHVQNKSDAPASEAQDTCEATVPNRTVPDSTVPYLTEPGTTQQDTTQPGPDVPGATLPDATQQDTTPREGADAVLCDVDGLPDGETPDGETARPSTQPVLSLSKDSGRAGGTAYAGLGTVRAEPVEARAKDSPSTQPVLSLSKDSGRAGGTAYAGLGTVRAEPVEARAEDSPSTQPVLSLSKDSGRAGSTAYAGLGTVRAESAEARAEGNKTTHGLKRFALSQGGSARDGASGWCTRRPAA
ncbi:MAG: hypothetical protein FJ317_02450 [SAR202 cluster bacterium]|nr:hypothetical protein [SAR202 cluster bacterium]